MRLPPVQPRSRRAHEAAKWAGSQGRLEDYNRALFQALFERGEDIGRIDVLTTLASALGMHSSALAHALEAQQFEPDVLADENLAATLGLGGVPAFVANRSVAITGVQPLSELQRLIRHARGLPNSSRASPLV